jgi:ferric-dicitrate binding protein FerR (iron transport regulator)
MNVALIEKYLAGDASQQEKELVQQWLEADENNRKEFATLRRLYDVTLAGLPAEERKRSWRPVVAGWWLRIAAAVLITFACSYYFLKTEKAETPSGMQTLHIPAGQRAELTLSDGTKVWLNSLSTFTFPDRFTASRREVSLEGEAWFEVAREKEKARPFTVRLKSYDIRVLGTEFNVSAYDRQGKFETSLLSGSLEIVSPDSTVRLRPGMRAYESGGQLATGMISDYSHFLWKKGIISFENERIEDILEKLRMYYDIEIRNENRAICDMRYTGKFRTKDGIEHVFNVLKIPAGFRYHKDSEANVIVIKR